MSDARDVSLFEFPASKAVDLRAIVQGPDGAPFVLDAATSTVYRIDLKNGKASTIFREGNSATGRKEAAPKLLAVGGRDLLILDEKNVVWRWRPANTTGKGTLNRFPSGVSGSSEWGNDVLAIGTFIRDSEANLYNFYVIDASAQQILRYSPAADGGGFPNAPTKWLSAARDVSAISSLYIDGDIWLADAGRILRVVNGNAAGWNAAAPGDTVVRKAPTYRVISSGSERRAGTVYGFDDANDRVIALSKVNGAFLGQYRLEADGKDAWTDFRGFFVQPGNENDPDSIVWITKNGLHRAVLQSAAAAGASPGPSKGASPAAK
jgi:hypothetical protein